MHGIIKPHIVYVIGHVISSSRFSPHFSGEEPAWVQARLDINTIELDPH